MSESLPEKKSKSRTRKGSCRMPRKYADISILLAGISLAFCLQYLFPSFRFVVNNIWPGNTRLSERIPYICTQFSISPNRMAIIVAIIVTIAIGIVIYFLISRRHDKDDEIIAILKQIRDKDVVNPSIRGANHAETSSCTKGKPQKEGKKKGGETKDN